MNLSESISVRVAALPADMQREAMTFVEFLESRLAQSSGKRLTTSLFVAQFAGSLGADFPDDMNEQDLTNDLPRANME
jgi:hypothetical protein